MRQGDVVIGELSPVRVLLGFLLGAACCGWAAWAIFLTLAYDAPLSSAMMALAPISVGFMSFIGPMTVRAFMGLPGLYVRDGHVTYLLPFHQYWPIEGIQAAFLSKPAGVGVRSWLTLKMNSGRRESVAIFLFRTPARLMLERLRDQGVCILAYDPDEVSRLSADKSADV